MLVNETITLALTGASGLQYGLRLLECLLTARQKVYLLFSKAAHAVATYELEFKIPKQTSAKREFLLNYFSAEETLLEVFDQFEWTAPIASGSSVSKAMVICPCSTGTLASIAEGMSNNLIERAADVILKENKKLILVLRETPLSLIHVENMRKLLLNNAVIMPASPGFYHRPTKVSDLVDFMVAKILDHLGVEHQLVKRWGMN
jgi:flavin prenyltransferase